VARYQLGRVPTLQVLVLDLDVDHLRPVQLLQLQDLLPQTPVLQFQ
jgi:hypothetical protein